MTLVFDPEDTGLVIELQVVDVQDIGELDPIREPEVCALRKAGRGDSLKVKNVFLKLIVKVELDINDIEDIFTQEKIG